MNSRAPAMFIFLVALVALVPFSAAYSANSTSNSTDVCVPEVNPRRYDFVRCVKLVNQVVDMFGSESDLVDCERDDPFDKNSVSHSMNNIAGYLHCVKYDSDWSISNSFKSFLKPKLSTVFACTADNLPFEYPVCSASKKNMIIGGVIAALIVVAIVTACVRLCIKKKNQVHPEPRSEHQLYTQAQAQLYPQAQAQLDPEV
jgi:hypothetical protein